MGIISIGVGNCTLGRRQTDRDGNVVSETPAKWETDPAGSCVAIVPLNSDTMEPDGPTEVFGDWQASSYLPRVVELIQPNRQINVPDRVRDIRKAEPRPRFKTEEEREQHRIGISRRNHARLFNANFGPTSLYSTLTFNNRPHAKIRCNDKIGA